MPWFKVDDGFASSEPVMRVKRRYRASVIGLWTLSGTWCAKELTDGRVPFHMIEELACTRAQADLLVACGLWADDPEGYVFIGWDKYQPTRSKIEADRKREAERKAAWRESQRDTAGTSTGQTVGHHAESEHPDPTRPDPTPLSTDVDKRERPAKRGSRLSQDWQPSAASVAKAREDAPSVDHRAEHATFVDYWIAQPGQKGVKTDWDATWRNWMRRKENDMKSRAGNKPTRSEANISVVAQYAAMEQQGEISA